MGCTVGARKGLIHARELRKGARTGCIKKPLGEKATGLRFKANSTEMKELSNAVL